MKKILLAALIAIGLSANAQRTAPSIQRIPAKKTTPATAKIIAPVLKPLESLSDIQIANALYVEIGLDNDRGADDKILKYYIESSSKIVNIAEIIQNKNKYYLVDRLNSKENNFGDSYEDNGDLRSTAIDSPRKYDFLRMDDINPEVVNKFRISSRNKVPINLVASNIYVFCQKEGNSFVERLQIGNDLVSQYFIKGTHSYIVSVDRSGKVTGIRSKDLIGNNQQSENYNISSERLSSKIWDFKFSDDLDAPAFRNYEVSIIAKDKNTDSNVVKFVHIDHTYLSNSDPSRKFYTDSIRIVTRMNDAMKDLKLVESRKDSIGKSLWKKREGILEEFEINYASHVEKDRQRLLKEEWGGKLDPRSTSYDSKLEMILAQAKANTSESFRKLELSSRNDVIEGMKIINEEYERMANIYTDLESKYKSLNNQEP